MKNIRGNCRHCKRYEILSRGICLKCNSNCLELEDMLIKMETLRAKLEKERHLKRLLEFQLRTVKAKLARAKRE